MAAIKGEVTPLLNEEDLKYQIGEAIVVCGSVYKIRRMSSFAFIVLRTGRSLIQCIYSSDYAAFDLENIKENYCVELKGEVSEDNRSKLGFEIRIKEVAILSKPAEEMPVVINNKKLAASLETILDYRPITLRNEKERAVFKLQEGICAAVRGFLMSQAFTEIHSPKIVYAGAEGGANIFRLDYFGREAYLAQSPQFYKQMMVGVYDRVYEIGAVYRAEKHDTSRHLNEYTSIDLEMGYIKDFKEIMEMETKLLQEIMASLERNYKNELNLLEIVLPKVEEIPCVTFAEAKEMIHKAYQREIKDYEDFEPEEERLLCELIKKQYHSEFVFVTHYPTSKRPFYAMEDKENQQYTLSFDLLCRGLEITTGGQRIHDYSEQVDKLLKRKMNPELFESYLMIHKYGIPPHGGLGMGLERLTMCLLGRSNVRETTLFPRDISRLEP
ncbi:aspartate--tRNA(Asn) ligase [Anaerocolumna cellulosilytica]|uniref:Aspartate--tRNA ligase n=1 Tax=Anaerocolumna cellulosilytica TaxID=433286 RepID=A0A6S6QV68_9FIRM|nr:aspartate--tRNA(Asn) ligase [Anaerocolumna cellulosilytica]MBB5197617.1 nondiscriminating aspartyl-tRNA synthetase [Anaerocolumna cellulosilytica]BCJ95143.1 aspartate--tRNA(Asn) ligase [Anaerocolumna cellulosilytica]